MSNNERTDNDRKWLTVMFTVINLAIAGGGLWLQQKSFESSRASLEQTANIHAKTTEWERSPLLYFDTADASRPKLTNFGNGPAFNVRAMAGQSNKWNDAKPMNLLPGQSTTFDFDVDVHKESVLSGEISVRSMAFGGQEHLFKQMFSVHSDKEGNLLWRMGEIHDYKINGWHAFKLASYIQYDSEEAMLREHEQARKRLFAPTDTE